jgi:hypothetical protein
MSTQERRELAAAYEHCVAFFDLWNDANEGDLPEGEIVGYLARVRDMLAAALRGEQPVESGQRHQFHTLAVGRTLCLHCGEPFSAVTFDRACHVRANRET